MEKDELQLGKVGRLIESNYKKRRKAYQKAVEALRTAAAHYRAEGEELKEVLKITSEFASGRLSPRLSRARCSGNRARADPAHRFDVGIV